ncbi:hypothetical protein [Parafrankia sp. CH37]|uniref:hypothetical protein n=1 Tax=Parafrankia sp. CH37 TaxID=683308 RepID=UPI00186815D9|nr:hypothetical protein [Parafrankia sp. CH37]MBE3203144.1 hypothetical protein [Parafrankia sp. CH37]
MLVVDEPERLPLPAAGPPDEVVLPRGPASSSPRASEAWASRSDGSTLAVFPAVARAMATAAPSSGSRPSR